MLDGIIYFGFVVLSMLAGLSQNYGPRPKSKRFVYFVSDPKNEHFDGVERVT